MASSARRIGDLIPDVLPLPGRQLELIPPSPPSRLEEERERHRRKKARKKGGLRKSRAYRALERAARTSEERRRLEELEGARAARPRSEGLWLWSLREAKADLEACRRSILARGRSEWFQARAEECHRAQLRLSSLLRELAPPE